MDREIGEMRRVLERQFKATITDWPELIKLFSCEALEAGAHWIRAGQRRDVFFYIAQGLLRIYYIDQNGKELNEGFYDERMMLGPVASFVSDAPCPFYIQALEPTTLWVASYPRFHTFAMDKPDILNFEITFMQNLFYSNAKRDAKRLLSSGEQRYRWFCREYGHLLERLPQYQIASFLGMTPVSLSRLRKQVQISSASRIP
ncbi:cAMP-binding domain of CRP or a regulatory subunit of cAMP-dependent protein kinases [Collimonas sp. OK307]|uniref:Crp/Fnr family transcriptional regulator n=1 Tax=Collimonas sp. OK307 TaxID=1801620 RepID=UPI0008E634F6|nr:Crp/Fnr family transcriptional regulator [Collimonas sp. OK307]SFI31939.1 cAMP-binding domain of CRP or a regulatory subunit of cAMP-dependent protein kinases [Collimonas sp. OK307]